MQHKRYLPAVDMAITANLSFFGQALNNTSHTGLTLAPTGVDLRFGMTKLKCYYSPIYIISCQE